MQWSSSLETEETEQEMGAVGVHGERVSEEALLTIRLVMPAYHDSWSTFKCVEFDIQSAVSVIPLKLVDLDLKAFFHI